MSTKAKSKTASAASPAPGRPDPGADAPEGHKARAEAVTVYLVSDRSRRASWMLGGLVLGGLLFWKFGTVAAAGGLVLMAMGLYHTWFFVRTLRFDAGSVVIDGSGLLLPTGLCQAEGVRVSAKQVAAAYFLRHAVPWNRSAPVLVIEAGEQAYLYPRDWFASEADQRRIMHAVLPLIESNGSGPASDGKA